MPVKRGDKDARSISTSSDRGQPVAEHKATPTPQVASSNFNAPRYPIGKSSLRSLDPCLADAIPIDARRSSVRTTLDPCAPNERRGAFHRQAVSTTMHRSWATSTIVHHHVA